ncbi:histidine phosphatase family protein [Clostridium sp. 19966]|uniref:histidine phosphatase family protein n=1 Tax=Clostridium sp. 19966 TaxID=2768166 RepID=UPI0028DFDEE0|nr:histidine phosphatase family protein [Clostridium sp. 19966]MDT8718424.1 histidine phosphatase family protein [Clostridium sp. 19966]
MAQFYLVRHGQPDYSPCDERGYIGHGRDLAPLSKEGIAQAYKAALDSRLKSADIIVSSPYTRALQTAAIISQKTNIDITVEMDLHEWMPDLTFQYGAFEEFLELYRDFNHHKGIYPNGEERKWEDLNSLRNRVKKAADKYAHYNKVIMVCHGMVINALASEEEIAPGEIIECHYEIGKADDTYSFA